MRCRAVGCLLAASIPTCLTFYAYAQEGLEEIVVTATRREENLQEVPISIVAVTGDTLALRGLDSLERVSQAIPNLVVTGGGGGTGQRLEEYEEILKDRFAAQPAGSASATSSAPRCWSGPGAAPSPSLCPTHPS